MKKPAPRTLQVIRKQYITPHMLRITLGGEGLADFPQHQESAYIKLIFPRNSTPDDSKHGSKPMMRTYTISGQRDTEIDVDFAIHDAKGPATLWALNTNTGDDILIGGPGPKKLINPQADWFLLVGDMTSLPAISVNLKQLPKDSRGYAVIEVSTEADRQKLVKPDNIEIQWVVNNQPTAEKSQLFQQVQQLNWLDGEPSVWSACEFHTMRSLRQYFLTDKLVPKSHIYISSYWKIDSNEDQHKVAKRADAETLPT